MKHRSLMFILFTSIALNHLGQSRCFLFVSGDRMSQVSEFWNSDHTYKSSETTTESSFASINKIISEFDEVPQSYSEYSIFSNIVNKNNNHKDIINEKIKYTDARTEHNEANFNDLIKLISNLGSINVNYDNIKRSLLSKNDLAQVDPSKKKVIQKYPSRSDVYWRLELNDEANYVIYWNYNYLNNHITIELELDLRVFQFGVDLFALGLSPNEEQINADWCVVWFDNTTSIQFRPAKTDHLGNMLVDVDLKLSKQSEKCKLIASSIHGNRFTIVYQRPLDPCEKPGYKIDNGTTHVVWFKKQKQIDDINDTRSIHVELKNKNLEEQHDLHYEHQINSGKPLIEIGFKRVQLLSPISTNIVSNRAVSPFSVGLSGHKSDKLLSRDRYYRRYLDITNDKLTVPSSETTYWCRMFKLPEEIQQNKHHITRYEAVIEQGNEHLVHHMELFHCEYKNSDSTQGSRKLSRLGQDINSLDSAINWAGSCSSSTRPKETQSCKRVILAWAMGARPLIYPKEVGQPIGGKDYNPYLMLEVHYNNVAKRSNIIDSSGLRLYYTNQLRDFDAGVIEVGLEYTDKNSIPPKVIAPLIGYCVSECTRVGLISNNDNVDVADDGDGSINIFAAQLHTHLTGISSWTQQIRGSKIIGELNRDDHYSPHFQEIRLLPEPVKLLPGDALVHYCLYDTRSRVNITLGGYAITDEMCVTYLHYYPKVQLEVCKSSIDTDALNDYFKTLAEQEYQIINWQNNTVAQNYLSIDWNPLRAAKLMSLYSNSPLSVQCNKSNGDRFPGEWNGIWPTKLLIDEQHQHYSFVSTSNQSEFIESNINYPRNSVSHPKCKSQSS